MGLGLRQRRPIEVTRDEDFINLYHVFTRMQEGDESLRDLILVRKKIAESRWWVVVMQAPPK
jgi:hypothetical protein